jgi:hypothetical protein
MTFKTLLFYRQTHLRQRFEPERPPEEQDPHSGHQLDLHPPLRGPHLRPQGRSRFRIRKL